MSLSYVLVIGVNLTILASGMMQSYLNHKVPKNLVAFGEDSQ